MRKLSAAIDNLQQEMLWLIQDWESVQEEKLPVSNLVREFENLQSPSQSPRVRKFNALTPRQKHGLEEAMKSPSLKKHDHRSTPKRRIVPTHVGSASSSCVICGRETNGSQLCRKTFCEKEGSPATSTPASSPDQITATPSPSNIEYWREAERQWHEHRAATVATASPLEHLADRAKQRANELFEDGFQRRSGEPMLNWVKRMLDGIDSGDLPFMTPGALPFILKQVPGFHADETKIAEANAFIETANLLPLYEILSDIEYFLEEKHETGEDAFITGFAYKAKGHRRESITTWVERLLKQVEEGHTPFKNASALENVYTRVGRVHKGLQQPNKKELLDAYNNPVVLKKILTQLMKALNDKKTLRL